MNDTPSSGVRGMTAEELVDVEAIFAAASDIETALRPFLLEQRCNGRPRVRAEVEALLKSHDRIGSFLEQAAAPPSPSGAADAAAQAQLDVGSLVGPYRLIQKIGQ